ncbi:MAG: FAD-dependent oxidoreductase [Deltaproteobacteria bacterium]|nr:FAD-dependent oxidoreductase [Deltaproteobacteria bacterium]
MAAPASEHRVEIAVFGGGIAGLWVLNRLCSLGYDAILVEHATLGCGQTLTSQGMIHGGQRYTLQARKTGHSEVMAAMAAAWAACLRGTGVIDLSRVRRLSDCQHLWSPGSVASAVAAFFATKAMRSRIEKLERPDWPGVFRAAPRLRGSVYRLHESVVDCKSLIAELAAPWRSRIYRAVVRGVAAGAGGIDHVVLETEGGLRSLRANQYVFSAGLGNEEILAALGFPRESTQRRPLKQVLVRNVPFALYAHCLTAGPRPRVSISAHLQGEGCWVWYLGGLVAEYGTDKTDDAAIRFAHRELSALFPWLDWGSCEWATITVDRAEPRIRGHRLPDRPVLMSKGNAAVVWPVKMTLAPALAEDVLRWVAQRGAAPTPGRAALPLPRPELGTLPWENARWTRTPAGD